MSDDKRAARQAADERTAGGGAPPVVGRAVKARVYRQLFDRESLAEYVRLSTDTVDRLVKAGKLPCVRIGQQVRFTVEDVDGFIARHRALGGAPR